MAIALYRKYRPDTFTQVIGQEHVTDALTAALKAGRISHAYLFSGPRGCGKTTSARIMARCLNCAEGPTPEPCGQCPSCRDLAAGGPGSLDVIEIDAASHNGVDDARELRERAAFAPTRDRYRIFILDEAHMVTVSGFNALLKLVEEPPEHVKFVFATTEPEKVLETIRSRTHHYPFRLVPPEVLVPYLQSVCQQEQVEVEDGVLPLVVRAGGGSVRDSMSVLDQLLAGRDGKQISYTAATALLGYTDDSLLDRTISALGAGSGPDMFAVIEEVVGSGHDPRRFTEDLLQRVRDMLISEIAGDRAAALLPNTPADQLARLREQAHSWGTRLLSRRADMIEEALGQMTGASAPRLQLELLAGRLLVETQGMADPVASSGAAPASAPVVAAANATPVNPATRTATATEPAAASAASAPTTATPAATPTTAASGAAISGVRPANSEIPATPEMSAGPDSSKADSAKSTAGQGTSNFEAKPTAPTASPNPSGSGSSADLSSYERLFQTGVNNSLRSLQGRIRDSETKLVAVSGTTATFTVKHEAALLDRHEQFAQAMRGSFGENWTFELVERPVWEARAENSNAGNSGSAPATLAPPTTTNPPSSTEPEAEEDPFAEHSLSDPDLETPPILSPVEAVLQAFNGEIVETEENA